MNKTGTILAFIVLGFIMFGGCGKSMAAAGRVPTALTNIGEHAEDIYDAIKAKDWAKSGQEFKMFAGDLKKVDAGVKGQVEKKKSLKSSVDSLGAAIKAKNRYTALEAANRITGIVLDMSDPYHPAVPVSVGRLDYYGRELEIQSAAKNLPKLKTTSDAAEKTWGSLRPDVMAHGGKSEAAKFDKLMEQLHKASTPAQYGKLATTILDEVDNLEKVFQK